MFTQLVESGVRPRRGIRGTALSFVAHYGLILAAVFTSAQAEVVTKRPRDEKVAFVEPRKVEPAKPKPVAPELRAAPIPPRVTSTFIAPVEIPSGLPEIDLTKAATDDAEFESRRSTSSAASKEPGSVPTRAADQAYFDFQVDKPVTLAPNSAAPQYPDILRQAGVEGDALVLFVVDTLGRVDLSSFKVIRASHDLFGAAVRNALPRMRFNPAETAQGKVRQVVQQPFTFSIVK
jgi:protein TonB